MALLIAR